ncbi:HisA/HisF-related TIM barrel protein [Xanthobacter agilis]|uniref:HisA/HisF-related TIM barrel protein n=1 Tax=Xanthobacter agilis TaxID=47492 RepID=UPI0037275E5F
MQLIPVIDLKGGRVVHARRGARDTYAPLESPLCVSPAPADVAAGLLSLAPFRTLYVADIDAITGAGHNADAIAALRRAAPEVELWVDAGETTAEAVRARAMAGLGVSVAGTESLPDDARAAAVLKAGAILSLDHDATGPLGPRALHENAALWPPRVIVMTLARVGSGEGPDLAALHAIQARRPDIALFAAGGVRGPDDLNALATAGTAGVLVATALHDRRINAACARGWCGG